MACGEQRHELMKWSVSDICDHVLICGCTSVSLAMPWENNNAGFNVRWGFIVLSIHLNLTLILTGPLDLNH